MDAVNPAAEEFMKLTSTQEDPAAAAAAAAAAAVVVVVVVELDISAAKTGNSANSLALRENRRVPRTRLLLGVMMSHSSRCVTDREAISSTASQLN